MSSSGGVVSGGTEGPDEPPPPVGAGVALETVKLVPPIRLMLPAESVALALTLTTPWPSSETSALLSTTACARSTPLAVRLLTRTWPLALKLTCNSLPTSAATVTAPFALLATAGVSVSAAGTSTGAAGARVSSKKLVLPLGLTLPAASVALALTLTGPWPSIIRSTALSRTACAAPVPVRLLLTLWPLALKFKTRLAPDSAATVTAPALPSAMLAFSMAPAATTTGALGSTVSRMKLAVAAALSCPPARALALTLTVPSPRSCISAALRPSALGLPLALRVLLTVWPLALKTTVMRAPASALTLTAAAPARAAFS